MGLFGKLTGHPLWSLPRHVMRPFPRLLSTLQARFPRISQNLKMISSKFEQRKRPDTHKEERSPKRIEAVFHSKTLEIVRSAFPSKKIDSLEIEKLGCAMTNEVFVCSLPSGEKVLLRFYGPGTETFFERHRELATFRKLSEKGFGPKLIASFETGRLEEYIDSDTLNKELIRLPDVSREVAHNLQKLHSLFPPAEQADCELWLCMDKWYDKALLTARALEEKGRGDELRRLGLHLPALLQDIKELRQYLTTKASSPVVFCHNDAQYGNILRKKSDGKMVLIDYEYAGYNYRGFDIGNHFCEWAADYDSPHPHQLDFGRYPTKDEQFVFFRAYLARQHRQGQQQHHHQGQISDLELRQEMEKMYWECNQFGLASHLKWCLWGIIQADQSNISFDYLSYASQRYAEYKKKKPVFLV